MKNKLQENRYSTTFEVDPILGLPSLRPPLLALPKTKKRKLKTCAFKMVGDTGLEPVTSCV